MTKNPSSGRFTLPGEAGYEKLTLELARRWGADVIRDSDGTRLSDEIVQAGYGIYSTLCVIREHNDWIAAHPDARQQTFLCTAPRVAKGGELRIPLMADFFDQQFRVNDSPDALPYWQVYDRTTGGLLPRGRWRYDAQAGEVVVQNARAWHRYTASFLAWRVWEEISMYNHVTNHWNKDHLMQLDPYHPGALAYLEQWLQGWCAEHPQTTVVRFTSLFYNFAWIWGADEDNRSLFTDWASYDFTVSPAALADFEREYGYALAAEDFVRGGLYNATHCLPTRQKRDWMDFVGRFVRRAARRLVDIVHAAGKQAYVFYDDSWVGLEPYNGHFEEFGFDGIIKCVFSGYEVRLCAGVPAPVHELRFHPYLFPVGLGGAPTFSPGGNPARDAVGYWMSVRRALARQKVERTGLGGYLHLVEDHPDFVSAIDGILEEFRTLAALHDGGPPLCLAPRVAVLHAWGALRSWTLSGHFHETGQFDLIHILESLSGLPFDVKFLSFEDVKAGALADVDVVINAGNLNSAWSGGSHWLDEAVVEAVTAWVGNGGVFVGVGEPSAAEGRDVCFQLAHLLGVDLDRGDRACHGRWPVAAQGLPGGVHGGVDFPAKPGLFLTDGRAQVLAAADGAPAFTSYAFGGGRGVYLSGFATGLDGTRFLQDVLLWAAGLPAGADGVTDNPAVECAVYPGGGRLVMFNNSDQPQRAACRYGGKRYGAQLAPAQLKVMELE